MKRTIFYEEHLAHGGKLVPFAGFEMPVEFAGVSKEHVHVREKVGVFDVSHMGEIWVEGPEATKMVQYVTSNDVQKLVNGKVQYSCFPNGKGGIVDDLLVYRFNDEKYLLVVNASNLDKDWNWMLKQNTFGAQLRNASDETAQLAIQGPLAEKVLQKVTDVDLAALPYYTFNTGTIGGCDNVIISNTGYTGAGGFELYLENAQAVKLFRAIMEAGKEEEIAPIGLAARDTLRLEMGFCLYGNDIDENTSPLEAGLGWITKFTEGNNFLDRERLEEQKEKGVKRRLSGFILTERGIARKGYRILNSEGEPVGVVTSGTMSPMTSKSIGMGYIDRPDHEAGSTVYIEIRNKQIPAIVTKPPFYKSEK